ncbi:VTT domain-containing protein [Patescibacteria group bacterium]
MTGTVVALGLLFLSTSLAPTFNFVLPLRPMFFLFVLPTQINWIVVAIIGIIGSVIGTLPLFYITRGVKTTPAVKKWLSYRWVKWFLEKFKNRPFGLIIFLILTPAPDQLLGVLGGLEGYQLRKFILANVVGRIILYFPVAFAGYLFSGNINSALDWFKNLFM